MIGTISKITRAGQITLPKKIRTNRAFSKASAVVFQERKNEIVIRPLVTQENDIARDHLPFVEYTMRDWLDPVNDNLFKMPKDV